MSTHWGRVMHIYVSKIAIIGSDNGLSPGRRQAIILTNAGLLSIGPLATNFMQKNELESTVCKISAILSRPLWVKIWGVICTLKTRRLSWYERSWTFCTSHPSETTVVFLGFPCRYSNPSEPTHWCFSGTLCKVLVQRPTTRTTPGGLST